MENLERLINLEIKDCSIFELVVADESFIDDIIDDLKKFLKLEILVKNNSIGIIVNNELSWDLQFTMIKKFVEYFSFLTYKCDCGKYEYKQNILYCKCGKIMCQDCRNIDVYTENEICDNCVDGLNNEELGGLI